MEIEKLASVISDASRKNALRLKETVRGLLSLKLKNALSRELDKTKKSFFVKK
jgi:hypothetical protein